MQKVIQALRKSFHPAFAPISFAIPFFIGSIAFGAMVAWTPAGGRVPFLLPESVTPALFLKKIRQEPDLQGFVWKISTAAGDRLQTLESDQRGAEKRVLLVANRAQDHVSDSLRISNFRQIFKSQGLEVAMLPVGASFGLKRQQEVDFFRDLSAHFGTFIFLGGDDKHPQLYGEKNTFSVSPNRLRDRLEEKLIRYLYFSSQRRIFGICRGLQQVFTSLGGKLIQDIHQETSIREIHGKGQFHSLRLIPTKNKILEKILVPLGRSPVLSLHHQMARLDSVAGTPFEVAAMSPEGAVEALESRDGRVLLVQFHPELSENPLESRRSFFNRLGTWIRAPNLSPRCRHFF